jgi:short-subunit dehydrogenase
MIKDWLDKTVIITGAASGIGRAVSKELAGRGAIVYVTALTLSDCQAVVDEINASGSRAHPAQLDVNNWDEFQGVINDVKQRHGKLDVLINNAAVLYVGEFYDMDESFIDKLVHTNLTAVTIGCLYAYRLMKQQGHGLIINISSLGGFTPTPTMAAYAATKHALIGLTHSLATEADVFGVDVKTVCFGLVDSELFQHAQMKQGSDQTVHAMLPIKALPTDIAARRFVDQLASNRRIVFVPFYARLMWWVYRFFPSLLFKGAPDTMKKYRRLITLGR